MADVLSKRMRSQVMATIRSKGNKATELKLVSLLRANRIKGWRRHQPLLGSPDFVFRQEKLAVFVDGCFWHGCRWHCRMPNGNKTYWHDKIRRNVTRDRQTTRRLKETGWRVLRIWEHSLDLGEALVVRIKSELRRKNMAGKNMGIYK